MVERSEIRYARAGEHHIAYREYVGDPSSDVEIVMVNGAVVPMDSLPDDPIANRLVEGLAGLGRLIVFDRRGIALSDAITDWETPLVEQWADDLGAVIEAAECQKPAIFSWHSLGFPCVYVARASASVSGLALFNPIANDALDPEFIAWVADVGQRVRKGEAPEVLELTLPGRCRDSAFQAWWDAAGRAGTSPGMSERIAAQHGEGAFVDYTAVGCPTLVVCRPPHWDGWPTRATQVVAERIAGAEYVELPAGDTLAIGVGVDAVLAEVSRFLCGSVRLPAPDRVLAAVLFTDLVDSTRRASTLGDAEWRSVLNRHDGISRMAVERWGGEVVKTTGDGLLAVVPSATAALAAARELRSAIVREGLAVRIGIHVGEIDRRGADVSGLVVNVAARVMAEAEPGQILVSEMVTHAVAATTFDAIGARTLKGVEGEWTLFAVA